MQDSHLAMHFLRLPEMVHRSKTGMRKQELGVCLAFK